MRHEVKRVVRVGWRTIRALREEFDEQKRDEFRKVVCGDSKPVWLEIHHIQPLSLGGGNEWRNLVLVPSHIHEHIHDYIDSQIIGMRIGEQRTIKIPMLSKEKMWLKYSY